MARQHFRSFTERFAGLPLRIGQLSRLVAAKEARGVKNELVDGRLDIVIGTHALLAKDVRFAHLGLLVVDEEQHFGVAQKERLKQLKADVHVLAMTATPIPRTLQLALSGVREMSINASPPIDRLDARSQKIRPPRSRSRMIASRIVTGSQASQRCAPIAGIQKNRCRTDPEKSLSDNRS